MALCVQEGVALVPQGGNSSLSGGSVPDASGRAVVLSTTRLGGSSEVDPVARQVSVGAGVTLEALQQAARAEGLFFPVDHAARGRATLGGMAATNAGGSLTFRYGTTRRHVAGVEAVLGDGSVISHLSGTLKDNTGYDLTGLLVGSEGTLGVITRLRLHLFPRPQKFATALVGLGSVTAALDLLDGLRSSAHSLHACELMFGNGVEAVRAHTRIADPLPGHQVYVLVECAAHSDPTPELAAALAHVPEDAVVVAATSEQRARLWDLRERHNETVNSLGVPHKMDVALPLGELARFVSELSLAIPQDARAICYGHLADGNLHVNVVGPPSQDFGVDAAVCKLTADLGGSISAEHGIGRAKREFLHLVRSQTEIDAMRAIKRALDPAGILNPGVLLP